MRFVQRTIFDCLADALQNRPVARVRGAYCGEGDLISDYFSTHPFLLAAPIRIAVPIAYGRLFLCGDEEPVGLRGYVGGVGRRNPAAGCRAAAEPSAPLVVPPTGGR